MPRKLCSSFSRSPTELLQRILYDLHMFVCGFGAHLESVSQLIKAYLAGVTNKISVQTS